MYVVEGLLEYQLDGRPPVTLKAGEVLFIPAGQIHAVKNVGGGKGAELATLACNDYDKECSSPSRDCGSGLDRLRRA